MRLADLNTLGESDAAAAFFRCCGSSRWARQMASRRPFANVEAMDALADTIWRDLDRSDWLEAFAAHPKIGGQTAGEAGRAGREVREGTTRWSEQEQAGVAAAEEQTKQRLAQANRDYEARFGYIFIVCATGKTAAQMLALLDARMSHDAAAELLIAAEEQRKITRLRLRKLLDQEPTTS